MPPLYIISGFSFFGDICSAPKQENLEVKDENAYLGGESVRWNHSGEGGHLNSTANGTGVLIPNQNYYLSNYANGQGAFGIWAGKYPGDLGNSLLVSIADSGSFPAWLYASYFQR